MLKHVRRRFLLVKLLDWLGAPHVPVLVVVRGLEKLRGELRHPRGRLFLLGRRFLNAVEGIERLQLVHWSFGFFRLPCLVPTALFLTLGVTEAWLFLFNDGRLRRRDLLFETLARCLLLPTLDLEGLWPERDL